MKKFIFKYTETLEGSIIVEGDFKDENEARVYAFYNTENAQKKLPSLPNCFIGELITIEK